MHIQVLTAAEAPGYYHVLKPLVEKAVEQAAGEYDADTALNRVFIGEHLVLVGTRPERGGEVLAVFIVAQVVYPQAKALRVVLAAGEPMDEWLPPLVEKLEEGCLNVGADRIELFGRPGFARALKDWATHEYTVMVRRVNHVGRG